jgi:hypothetical protein
MHNCCMSQDRIARGQSANVKLWACLRAAMGRTVSKSGHTWEPLEKHSYRVQVLDVKVLSICEVGGFACSLVHPGGTPQQCIIVRGAIVQCHSTTIEVLDLRGAQCQGCSGFQGCQVGLAIRIWADGNRNLQQANPCELTSFVKMPSDARRQLNPLSSQATNGNASTHTCASLD